MTGTTVTIAVEAVVTDPQQGASRVLYGERAGEPIRVTLWNGHLGPSQYRLEPGLYQLTELSTRSRGDITEFFTTSASTLTHCEDLTGTASFVVCGDTHLGYDQRGEWATPYEHGDCRDRFQALTDYVCTTDVDGIVHTGDIFDDNIAQVDTDLFRDCLDQLADAGVRFYYVRGNHGSMAGDALLGDAQREGVAVHLQPGGVRVRGGWLHGFGYDRQAGQRYVAQNVDERELPQMLVAHATLAQLSDHGLDIDPREIPADAVASGHHHAPAETVVDGVPVIYTGALGPPSKMETTYTPTVWRLDMDDPTGLTRCSLNREVARLGLSTEIQP